MIRDHKSDWSVFSGAGCKPRQKKPTSRKSVYLREPYPPTLQNTTSRGRVFCIFAVHYWGNLFHKVPPPVVAVEVEVGDLHFNCDHCSSHLFRKGFAAFVLFRLCFLHFRSALLGEPKGKKTATEGPENPSSTCRESGGGKTRTREAR